jgi:hypothetical protein
VQETRGTKTALLWRRLWAIPCSPKKAEVSGDFPQSSLCSRPRRSLFVSFECDSLSEELKRGKLRFARPESFFYGSKPRLQPYLSRLGTGRQAAAPARVPETEASLASRDFYLTSFKLPGRAGSFTLLVPQLPLLITGCSLIHLSRSPCLGCSDPLPPLQRPTRKATRRTTLRSTSRQRIASQILPSRPCRTTSPYRRGTRRCEYTRSMAMARAKVERCSSTMHPSSVSAGQR